MVVFVIVDYDNVFLSDVIVKIVIVVKVFGGDVDVLVVGKGVGDVVVVVVGIDGVCKVLYVDGDVYEK